jgi:hypothetical protein
MAASTPAQGSAAWGSAAILAGLPSISDRGGVGALEGPDLVEAVLFSPLGSGAALVPDGAGVPVEGASGVVVVLATAGAAGAAPIISGMPPALGGSVVLGAAVAPGANCASEDARSSSSLTARCGVVGVAVAAGSGPGVVCPVFLFFLLFFSSFFSSASLGRKGKKEVRGKVRQEVRIFVQEHSRGVSLHPSSLARNGRGWRRGRGGLARRLLAMGGPSLGLPAGAFVVELGAALRLQAGLAPLLLQVSRGGHVDVSLGGLVRQGGAVVGGI